VAYQDLREFIKKLEREGELKRISAEVDPVLEITEITDRVTKAGGPALFSRRPRPAHSLLRSCPLRPAPRNERGRSSQAPRNR